MRRDCSNSRDIITQRRLERRDCLLGNILQNDNSHRRSNRHRVFGDVIWVIEGSCQAATTHVDDSIDWDKVGIEVCGYGGAAR